MSTREVQQTYDRWSQDYDQYLPWEEKFAQEARFYAGIFREHEARSVLDAGCGTGRHAVKLAQEGFRVTGSDLSPGMLEQARARATALGLYLAWFAAAFDELPQKTDQRFDGILSAGSALAHLTDDDAFRAGVAGLLAVLRPGGVLVTENIHFAALNRSGLHFGPLEVTQEPAGPKLWLKVLDYRGAVVNYSVVTMQQEAGSPEWGMQTKTFDLRADMHEMLPRVLRELGAEVLVADPNCQFGQADNPYVRKHPEPKTVVVARKPG